MDCKEPPETRLYVPCDLCEGHRIVLSHAQTHQVKTVQRLAEGNSIALFNGRDGEWLARLRFEKKSAAAEPMRQTRPQTPLTGPWLLFAPIKHGRIDFLVEKATELGAARLAPVITERTQVARVNTGRLWDNAREAAEQSERLDVPDIAEPVRLEVMLKEWDPARTLFLCAESGDAVPVRKAFLSRHSDAAIQNRVASALPRNDEEMNRIAFLIGPEGGFSTAEFTALRALPFVVPVSLGPRILRAETAALAVLACWQMHDGPALQTCLDFAL